MLCCHCFAHKFFKHYIFIYFDISKLNQIRLDAQNLKIHHFPQKIINFSKLQDARQHPFIFFLKALAKNVDEYNFHRRLWKLYSSKWGIHKLR